MNSSYTTDELFLRIEPPIAEDQPMRFVDMHIYDCEPEVEELEPIESHLEQETALSDKHEQEPTEPLRPLRKQRTILALGVGLVCVLVASELLIMYVLPLFTPDATITIIASTQLIRTTHTITVTTGQATGTQLQGRALAAIMMSQERTVPTTGEGHQNARAAYGFITFYNAATFPQTVTAGTLLTGADGILVITDADAVLPAGTLATNGQRTVPAHALQTGPVGNIRAGEIYGACCRLNVFAANIAFTGGQQARDYPTVTQQDITTVVSSLTMSVNQSVQAALQTQVHPDETLITPFPCQQNVKPDHQIGEEAARVTILVSETCTGITYHTQTFHILMTQIITQQACKQLGDGYTIQGDVQASINKVSRNGLAATLQTTIAAIWGYQFTQAQQAQIKAQIAGKSKSQAIQTLLHIPGVQSVSLESEHMPTDVSHIHLVIVVIQ